MRRDIVICIGTIGSPTFERCRRTVDAVAVSSRRVDRVVVIRDKRPQSAWLNQMRLESRGTKWCMQVDEDMYLHKNALLRLLEFAEKKEASGARILNASSLLYDLFLEREVGSLKLWSSKALAELEFRDILGGDRDIAKRAKSLGYKNYSINDVLGSHDSAPTAAIAFSKYYEYTQKIRKFRTESSARKFCESLRLKWEKNPTYINKKAYDGSKHGLADSLKDKSKR
tara:strand:- start:116 stop:796 length:681 start_codon:yes stop_codon:yes gene_type:complete